MKIENLIKSKALPSFCTSNLDVIRLAILYCKLRNYPILIESTSSQVNQHKGYSGKNPKNFFNSVNNIAKKLKYQKKLYIGGDHLGPLPWKNKNSKLGIKNSIKLINDCLKSNYSKIHIDTSIKCSDDTKLTSEEIFSRTKIILNKIKKNKKLRKIFLIIGTEVPLSGGNDKSKIKLTSKAQIIEEVKKFKNILKSINLMNKTFGLVIEPGMKFMDYKIQIPKFKNFKNKQKLSKKNKFVYEAHSTDYQPKSSLKKLVNNNFKFLKVGPELTYNYCRSLFLMEKIERSYQFPISSNFEKKIMNTMQKNKKYWKNYYSGNKRKLNNLLLNSKLDRMRYYLNVQNITKSIDLLRKNINKTEQSEIIKYLKKRKIIFNNKLINKANFKNFDLINFIFLEKTFQKYYSASGYKN